MHERKHYDVKGILLITIDFHNQVTGSSEHSPSKAPSLPGPLDGQGNSINTEFVFSYSSPEATYHYFKDTQHVFEKTVRNNYKLQEYAKY